MIRGEEAAFLTAGAVGYTVSPQDVGGWVVPVIVAIVTVLGTWFVARMQHRGRPEHALIDQLQEEMVAMKEDINGLKAEQSKAIRRERIRDDYISQLRRHIEEGNPPPPPPWPDELLVSGD